MNDIILGINPELPMYILRFLENLEECPTIVELLNMGPNDAFNLFMDTFNKSDDESDDALIIEVSMLHVCLLCAQELEDVVVNRNVVPWLFSEYIRYGSWDRSNITLSRQAYYILSKAKPVDELVAAA
jgi:hypothetical protein